MSALTTRSPSRSSTILTVPWVAGCDGPICIRISGVSRSRDGSAGGTAGGAGGVVGSPAGIILDWVFFRFWGGFWPRVGFEFCVGRERRRVRRDGEAAALK